MFEDSFTEPTHAWWERRIETPFGQSAGLGYGRARRPICAQNIDG
jgi:hypothetical protein